jgi:hypothetical protein
MAVLALCQYFGSIESVCVSVGVLGAASPRALLERQPITVWFNVCHDVSIV